jgi:CheY-like chemotaxis protein
VLLTVSDTGTGMDAPTAARIFEPFFTTKSLGNGTGLGLATVYGIVKQSEGEIRVYSELGHGATFKVYLPRLAVRGAVAGAPLGLITVGGSERILLVEDDPAVRSLATGVLESAGYDVLVAAHAEQAADLIPADSGHIDLLLTDVVMPGMNGIELARRATRLRPGIRVLFMSGYPGEVAVRHGLLGEADAYLSKPFNPRSLSQKVREVLDGKG